MMILEIILFAPELLSLMIVTLINLAERGFRSIFGQDSMENLYTRVYHQYFYGLPSNSYARIADGFLQEKLDYQIQGKIKAKNLSRILAGLMFFCTLARQAWSGLGDISKEVQQNPPQENLTYTNMIENDWQNTSTDNVFRQYAKNSTAQPSQNLLDFVQEEVRSSSASRSSPFVPIIFLNSCISYLTKFWSQSSSNTDSTQGSSKSKKKRSHKDLKRDLETFLKMLTKNA